LSDVLVTNPQIRNPAFQFQVVAFKNNGSKIETSVATSPSTLLLTTNTFGVPTAFGISKVSGNDGTYQINFTDNATTEIYYRLGFKRSSDTNWSPSNEFQFGLFGETSVRRAIQLIPGTSYDFQIRGERDGSLTAYSAPIVTLTTDPLSPPSDLSVVAIDDDRVRLNWKDNSTNTMGYEMQYRFVGSTDFTPLSGGSGI
jgi:hypothetical protein